MIDELGTAEEAISHAAELAGLGDYRVNHLEQDVSPLIELLRSFGLSSRVQADSYGLGFAARLGQLFAAFEDLSQPKASVMCADCLIEVL